MMAAIWMLVVCWTPLRSLLRTCRLRRRSRSQVPGTSTVLPVIAPYGRVLLVVLVVVVVVP